MVKIEDSGTGARSSGDIYQEAGFKIDNHSYICENKAGERRGLYVDIKEAYIDIQGVNLATLHSNCLVRWFH
jgi:hypothetical protein